MRFTFVGAAVLQAKAVAAITEAVTLSGEDLVGKSQERTPVGPTGHLKAGQHSTVEATATGATATVATGGESSEYAFYVHEGTSRMGGRPFLAQALMDNAPVYVEAMRRAASGAF